MWSTTSQRLMIEYISVQNNTENTHFKKTGSISNHGHDLNNRYQELAQILSHESIGIKYVNIDQADETMGNGQGLKEVKFEISSY